MAKKNNLKLIIPIIIFAIMNITCFMLLVGIEQTGAFERITGLEFKQKGNTLVAKWDKVKKADAYDVIVKNGPDETYYISIPDNKYVIENIQPGTKYVIKVSAESEFNNITDEEKKIKTAK